MDALSDRMTSHEVRQETHTLVAVLHHHLLTDALSASNSIFAARRSSRVFEEKKSPDITTESKSAESPAPRVDPAIPEITRRHVNGHRFLPTGGHEIPHWWPSFLPAGGHQMSPLVAIESPHRGLRSGQVRGLTPLPAVAVLAGR